MATDACSVGGMQIAKRKKSADAMRERESEEGGACKTKGLFS